MPIETDGFLKERERERRGELRGMRHGVKSEEYHLPKWHEHVPVNSVPTVPYSSTRYSRVQTLYQGTRAPTLTTP